MFNKVLPHLGSRMISFSWLLLFSGLNYKIADKRKQTLFFSGGNKNTFSLSCCSQTPFSHTFRLLEMSMNLSKLLNMYWFWTTLNMALCDYFFSIDLILFSVPSKKLNAFFSQSLLVTDQNKSYWKMPFVILIGFSLCNFKDWDDVAFNFNSHMNFQAFIVILPKQINEFLFFSIRNFFFVMTLINGNILCGSHVTTEEPGPRNPQHRL